MSSINKTPHYNLSQFGDSPDDKPSWRGDYTADMSKIDSQMYRNETGATTATSTANTAKSTADNALSQAQTNKDDIAEHASYFTALGVTSEPTAQALMSTINGKAENTALTELRGTVSSLSGRVDGKADATQVYTKAQADTTFTKQGGYAGTAQTLNASINKVSGNLTELLEALKPIEILNKNFNFHGIGAGNSGRANVRAFAIPGCKIAFARIILFSSKPSLTGTSAKWPDSPYENIAEQPTTSEVSTAEAIVAGNIPAEYRPSVPFRLYEDFSLTIPWGLGVEVWPNGDVQIYKFSGNAIPSGTFINAPGTNIIWTYGQTGV